MINKMLRILAVLIVAYFVIGTLLDAYYGIIIYPDSFASVFAPLVKHTLIIHKAAVEVLEKIMRAGQEALHGM